MDGKQPTVRVVPAARGLMWFAGALMLIRRQPASLLLIGLVLQLIMGFAQAGVLALLLVMMVPAFTAGVLQAMLAADQGRRPPLMLLFVAFSDTGRLLRLFSIGALMLGGGIIAVMFILSGSLDGLDPEIVSRMEAGDVEALYMIDPVIVQRLLVGLAGGLLVSGVLSYFAVPLVWFSNLRVGAAIFLGLRGMTRNWRPFLVLAVLMGILAVPVAIMTGLLLGLSATGSGGSMLFTLVMLALMVIYQLVLFGSQYLSFKEVFGADISSDQEADDGRQLVA